MQRPAILLLTAAARHGKGPSGAAHLITRRTKTETIVAKQEWGTKRLCPNCGTRYYDMHHDPIVCPRCGAAFDPEALLKTRRTRTAAVVAAVEPVADEEIEPDLGAEEEVAPAVAAVLPIEAAEGVEEEEEEGEEAEAEGEEEEEEEVIEDASELGEDEDDMAEVIENVDEEDE
jgi:uncharacterized protein (TIGR02300 family)